jgi:iron complex outermembrane receptor protein
MRIVRFAASAATAALCLLHGQATFAQATPPTPAADPADQVKVPEIVVTAQLRRQNAQSVPVSVTAVSGDSLARNNVASLQDLAGAVPGLVVSKSISYGLAPISIRGLGGPAGGGSLFTDQPVAVYVDGVYVPALGQSVSDFLDVDTVQVLRGPQGTLYGRNSTSGALLISSKRPQMTDFGAEAHASIASFDEVKLAGAVNIPILSDVLSLRVAGGYNSGGNWAHNTVDNRKFGGGNSSSGRASLRYKPGNGLTVDLIVDHSEGTSNPATMALSTAFPVNTGPALGKVYLGDPYARRSDFATALNSHSVQIVAPQYTHTVATDATLLIDKNFGGVTLTSITGYRDFHVSGAQDASPYTVPAAVTNTNTTDQRQKSFSQELRLASGDSGRFNWTLGAYYFHQDTNAFIDIIALQGGPPVATGFGRFGPVFAGAPSGTNALFIAQQKVDALAAFADLNYKLTDTLTLTGGLRYSRDRKDANIDNTVTTITPTLLAGPILSAGSCASCIATFSNVSPRAVVTYKPTSANMVYASFTQGFNSGGFNNFGNVTNPQDPTNPLENSSEKISNYEIGTKNDFLNHALRVNVSAFMTDYDNLHIRQAVLTGGVAIVNVPKARVKGVEVETIIAPVAHLTLAINGTYLDGRIRQGTLSALPTNTGPIIVGQNQTIVAQDVSGNHLTRAPDWQGSASATYSLPTALGSLSGTVTWRAQTKSYFLETNQDSNQYIGQGWSEVDLRVALAGDKTKWEVAAFGKNVFDNRHISQIVPFSGFPIATLNNPATWGLAGSVKF